MRTRSLVQDNPSPPMATVTRSRRQFLGTATGAALGWLAGCAPLPTSRSQSWSSLAAGLQGPLLMPGNANFAAHAQPWALQYATALPQAIAQCASEEDVGTCLKWANSNNVPLVARSGGHSYAGYSTTTGLMIDVSAMNTVKVDAVSGIAVVAGGARNKHVYAACRPLERAVTHGRCRDVGVAGLVLGGGIGFNMRAHGLTCDSLIETRIVLADGRTLTCNASENADLFWACRGAGGGNFGVHTSFTFQTYPVGRYTVFDMQWTEQLIEVFAALQDMAMSAPNGLGMKLGVTAQAGEAGLTLNILGQFAGSQADFLALLAPVFLVRKPRKSVVEERGYWDAQEFVSEDGAPEYSHERSRFVRGSLSATAIQTIFSSLREWPGTTVAATWKFFLMGGKIDDISPSDMAFVNRGYSMLSSIELEWTQADSFALLTKNQVWLSRFHERMAEYTSAHCYQNFIDPSQSDYLHAYYGENLPRLQAIKRKFDVTNLLRYPQSIPA